MMKRCVREAGQSLAAPCHAQGRTLGVRKHSSTPDVSHLRSCGTGGRNELPAGHLKFPGIWWWGEKYLQLHWGGCHLLTFNSPGP